MPRTRPTKNRKFPYDPLMLGLQLFGFVGVIGPKIQQIVSAGGIIGPKLYACAVDTLWGQDDGQESALWGFLTGAKPDGLTQAQHEAWADLTECGGRISADWIEGIPQCIDDGIAAGKSEDEIARDVRALVNQALDDHDLEADVVAVVRAMK